MLFNREHFGKKISEQLSEIITKNTITSDRHEAVDRAGGGGSESTLRAVVYRSAPLTYNNQFGVIELMRIALRNIQETRAIMNQHEDFLLEKLDMNEVEIG